MKRSAVCLLFSLLPFAAQAEFKATLSQDQAWEKISAKQITVIDVRTPAEFATGHVPGAINIPLDQIGQRLQDIPAAKDQPLLVYCRSGRRAGLAEDVLSDAGYSSLYNLDGDMLGWSASQRPITK